MIRVGIVGGTGYTGVELLRILALHPGVEVTAVTSRADAGLRVDQLYPSLRGLYDLQFTLPEAENLRHCDAVFFATPNGTAMTMAAELLTHGVRILDLSADFRLKDVAEWEKWYGMTHAAPNLIAEAVYGLPEVNREQIRQARLIACPGCYPTAVQLGFLPLLESGVVSAKHLIADVKSGVSGAGRKAEISSLLSEAGESFKAYAVAGHRHLPEITQGLQIAAIVGIDARADAERHVDEVFTHDNRRRESRLDIVGDGRRPGGGDALADRGGPGERHHVDVG